GVGAAEEHAPVGVVPERRPDLLAGHLEVIAPEHRLRAQRGQVRARARLGEAEAPEVVGGQDARGEAPLLRLAAVGEDGRAGDAGVANAPRRPGARHLLHVAALLGAAGVAPAVLPGPRDPDPARLGQPPLPGAEPPDALVLGEPGGALRAEIARDVLFEPGAEVAAEGVESLLCHAPRIARTGRVRRVRLPGAARQGSWNAPCPPPRRCSPPPTSSPGSRPRCASPAGSPSTPSSCGSGPTALSWASCRWRPTGARR